MGIIIRYLKLSNFLVLWYNDVEILSFMFLCDFVFYGCILKMIVVLKSFKGDLKKITSLSMMSKNVENNVISIRSER